MNNDKMNFKTSSPLFLLLAVLISLLLAGCGAAPTSAVVLASSTPQSTPSSTMQPTATMTSLPTETPTPIPSPTQDLEATAAAKKTETAEAINATVIPDLEKYGVDPEEGHVVWADKKAVKMDLTSYMENKDHVLKEAGKLSDFVMQTKVTWITSGALSLCGVSFHVEDDLAAGLQNRFFMMRLQFAPGWTIWRWEKGMFQSFVTGSWLPSADIHDDNGSSNIVGLVVRGKDIDVFINRDKQRRVEDKNIEEGLLTLSAYQESGETTCKFENTWVWTFDK